MNHSPAHRSPTALKADPAPVIIFGAAAVGEALYHVCRTMGIEVACFTDNRTNLKGQTKCGLEIVHTPTLKSRYPDANIIISAADIQDVVVQLGELGYPKWYPASDFLRDIDLGSLPLSVTPDFAEFAISTCLMCQDAYYQPEKVFMRSMDIVVTERCSMKCKDCSNLMQYYERPQNIPTDEVFAAIDALCESVDGINEFRVIGGEPFMNKDIHLTLKRLNDEPKVRKVVIYTNGTLLPRPEQVEALQHPKTLLMITDYGPNLSRKTQDLLAFLDERKIAYYCHPPVGWTDCSSIVKHDRDNQTQAKLFRDCCAKNLFTIMGSKLFRCPFAANADRLKAIPDLPRDYVDLLAVSDPAERKALLRDYIFSLEYMDACDWCAGRFLSAPEIEPAIQVKAPIPYAKLQ